MILWKQTNDRVTLRYINDDKLYLFSYQVSRVKEELRRSTKITKTFLFQTRQTENYVFQSFETESTKQKVFLLVNP